MAFDVDKGVWTYTPPRVGWLPSAVDVRDARQMLDWFIPAWVMLLALRAPIMGPRSVRLFCRLTVLNAGLLALFGVVQYSSGTDRMYGVLPMQAHFFSTFGYPNHAGSFFLLAMGLSAGLLAWDLRDELTKRRALRAWASGSTLFISLAAANLSFSRFAILISWLMLVGLVCLLTRYAWPRLRPVQRVHYLASVAGIALLVVLLTVGLGREGIRREFENKTGSRNLIDVELNLRSFQWEPALDIWSDNFLFGAGGWGYRHMVGQYTPREHWGLLTEGKANAHSDPLQFLAEFGAAGAGAMLLVVVTLTLSALRGGGWRTPVRYLPLAGVAVVGVQSFIDLPFRSPAVMLLWLACLASAGRVLQPASEVSAVAEVPPNRLSPTQGVARVTPLDRMLL